MQFQSQLLQKSEQLSQIQKSIIEKQQKKKSEILELSQSSKNQKHFKNLIQMFDVLQQKPFKAQEYETILKLLQSIPKYDSNFEFISVGAKGLVLGTFNKTLGFKTVLKIQQVQSKHEVVQEVGIMRDCQMPLVIKFYGYFYLSVNKNDDFVVYEIEKCSGNLKQYLTRLQKENIALTDNQKMQIAVQIIDVVNYLNYNGIVHRDIKLDNILYIESQSDVP
ncbi:kinase domain protein, partial (macronuclear) [Tetrahymena thermophila SB210]